MSGSHLGLGVRVGRHAYALQLGSAEAANYFGRAYRACPASREGDNGPCDRICLAPDGAQWVADCNGESFARGTLAQAIWQIDWMMVHCAVTEPAGCPSFHAGWVERAGGALLIAGDGGSGKSGLCLQLLDRGFRLGAEDVTFIDADRLWPFPRAIQLRTCNPLLKTVTPVRLFPGYDGRICVDIHAAQAAPATPVFGMTVMILDNSRAAGPPRPLPALDALQRLLAYCHRSQRIDQRLFDSLVGLAVAGRIFVVSGRSDADSLIALMEAQGRP